MMDYKDGHAFLRGTYRPVDDVLMLKTICLNIPATSKHDENVKQKKN